MKQKTLNRLDKYAKENGLRFGQLLYQLSYPQDIFDVPDEIICARFGLLWKQKHVRNVDSITPRNPASSGVRSADLNSSVENSLSPFPKV